jgi:hypothetical protein
VSCGGTRLKWGDSQNRYDFGKLSQAIPSPLRSRPWGSSVNAFRTAWASAWVLKSLQLQSVWLHSGKVDGDSSFGDGEGRFWRIAGDGGDVSGVVMGISASARWVTIIRMGCKPATCSRARVVRVNTNVQCCFISFTEVRSYIVNSFSVKKCGFYAMLIYFLYGLRLRHNALGSRSVKSALRISLGDRA